VVIAAATRVDLRVIVGLLIAGVMERVTRMRMKRRR